MLQSASQKCFPFECYGTKYTRYMVHYSLQILNVQHIFFQNVIDYLFILARGVCVCVVRISFPLTC